MAEHRSALIAVYEPGRIGVPHGVAPVAIHERAGRTLLQISGWPSTFDSFCPKLGTLLACPIPVDGRRAVSAGTRSIFRVGPERIWIAGPADDEVLCTLGAPLRGDDAVVTEIGDSRTVLRVAGAGARLLLNRGLPVDLDGAAFPADAFAQSVIHHTPVLVHRVGTGEDRSGIGVFDVYVTRDYAVSFWEWLTGAAESLGCEIGARE